MSATLAKVLVTATIIASTFGAACSAETVRIVAVGASNTSGRAVGAANAWPAVLERMLRAKGMDVRVENDGVAGETSAQTLSRVGSLITPGTRIVIFDLGGGNDRDSGGADTRANGEMIAAQIRAHGAVPINAAKVSVVGTERSNPSAWIAGDPHHHITAASQYKVAASLVPKVAAALKRKH